MNRKQRREARQGKGPLAGKICEHGNPMKTDGTGTPMCPHGCGFSDWQPPSIYATYYPQGARVVE